MQRRALLAAIPTALAGSAAGCIGGQPGNTDTTTQTTDPDATFVVSEFTVETEKVAPTYQYLVRITKVYSADAVADEPGDQTIVDVSDIEDPDVRAVIKNTLREGKLHRDSIPDGLREITERVDFFTWNETTSPDDTASHWGIEVFKAHPNRAPVIQFDAELTDNAVSPGNPAAITFSIENVGDTTQEVFSGTVPPFGVLWADGPNDERYLLWRDYQKEGCVNFQDDRVIVCSIGKITPVEPGQRIEKTYELRPENPVGSPLEPGDYTVTGTLTYHQQSQGPSTKVDWRVSFRVDQA